MSRFVSPREWRRDTWILVLGTFMLMASACQALACGHGAAACKVVDIAHDACGTVRYLAPDGTVEELSTRDLEDLAKAKRVARERAKERMP